MQNCYPYYKGAASNLCGGGANPCPPSPCPPGPCPPSPCPPGPCPPKPCPPKPFLSSYIEAVASTQSVESKENIVFNTDEESIDIVGSDIEVDSTGSVFTIKRPGLYHVEWSVNLLSGTPPIMMCLLENNMPSSALSNYSPRGNYSSGALINVTEDSVPFTVSLHNFGEAITIEEHTGFEGTAGSLRILRFADGPAK